MENYSLWRQLWTKKQHIITNFNYNYNGAALRRLTHANWKSILINY